MERKTLTIKQVQHLLSLGKTKTYALINSGELESLKVGSRRLVLASSVDELVERGVRASKGMRR